MHSFILKPSFTSNATIVGSIDPQCQGPSEVLALRHRFDRVYQTRVEYQQSTIDWVNVHPRQLGLGVVRCCVFARTWVNAQGTTHLGCPTLVAIENASVVAKVAASLPVQ